MQITCFCISFEHHPKCTHLRHILHESSYIGKKKQMKISNKQFTITTNFLRRSQDWHPPTSKLGHYQQRLQHPQCQTDVHNSTAQFHCMSYWYAACPAAHFAQAHQATGLASHLPLGYHGKHRLSRLPELDSDDFNSRSWLRSPSGDLDPLQEWQDVLDRHVACVCFQSQVPVLGE